MEEGNQKAGPAWAKGKADLEAFARMCKAMGHPARVRILQHLKEVDGCICGQIVATLPLAQSTVSQHLKSLKQAGLIRGEVEGPAICYCIDRTTIALFKRLAAAL